MVLEHVSVNEVMSRWPETIGVFIQHGMGCVGCPVARFHSVEEACREHDLECSRFLSDLRIQIGVMPPSAASFQLEDVGVSPPSASR